MLYIKDDKRYNEGLLKRQGIIVENFTTAELETIGFFILSDSRPAGYNPEFSTLTDDGNVQDGNGNWSIDWSMVDDETKRQAWFKSQKMNEAETKFIEDVSALTNVYKQPEIDSWMQQQSEAQAYIADNATPVPLLNAIATNRGVTVDLLATNIMVKVNAYQMLFGEALGKKQKVEDDIDLINQDGGTTIDEKIEAILAIVVTIPVEEVV